MIGQRVGNYRITSVLGEGGMGTVYLAEHPSLGRQAAVKVLHSELTRNAQMVQRFFNEARAANAVGHPGIVEISDVGTLPSGEPYLVMELLRGQSLGARLRGAGRLSVAQALDFACQTAGALGAAHEKGIVHRDLKPDNLFLVADPLRRGRELVKVLDFGIAKLSQPADSGPRPVTRTGTMLGTPQYMSPEQCRATKDVDQRADIYSLGLILFEMLTGTPPFASDSSGELVHMHIGVEPPALRSRNVELPEALEPIVRRALEKDPAARFSSMEELRQALTAGAPPTLVLEGSEPAPTRTVQLPAPAPPARSTTFTDAASEVQAPPAARAPRNRLLLAAGGALGVAAVIAVAVTTGEKHARRPPPETPSASTTGASVGPLPAPIAVEIATTPAGAQVVRARDGAVLGLAPPEPETAPTAQAPAPEAAQIPQPPASDAAVNPPGPPVRRAPTRTARAPAAAPAPKPARKPTEPLKI